MAGPSEAIFINRVLSNLDRETSYLTRKSQLEALFNSKKFTLKELYQPHDFVKDHCLAVCELASKIAHKIYGPKVKTRELTPKQANMFIDNIETAAKFHDVAKLIFPRYFLNRDIKLGEDELKFARRYPVVSYYMLYDILQSDTLRLNDILESILFHHEKFDGGGPAEEFYNSTRGKKKGDKGYAMISGEKIPLAARILAVADTYDAMHRRGETLQDIRQELVKEKGKDFDPTIVETCLDILYEDQIFSFAADCN